MKLIRILPLCALLGFVFAAACSNCGLGSEEDEVDYLPNPLAADRPDWDPYSPASYDSPQLVSADPSAPDLGLSIGDEVLSPNQLYLQSGGLLVTSGQISLGNPYTLWLYVANWGTFNLYDRGSRIFYSGFVSPGWYRMDRYAETLESHYYQFNTSRWSNSVTVAVNPGGYPTSYSLVGRVVDGYGGGISGVRVRISGSEGGVFTTTTNALGYYGMDVPTGTYTLTAEADGFGFTTSTARVWTGTVSVAGVLVGYSSEGTVYPTGSDQDEYGWLEGTVTDKSGVAIPGANVKIDGLFSVTADEDGGYWVSLSPGWHSITADASGYKFSTTSVQIRSDQGSGLNLQGTKVIVLGSGTYS